MTVAVAPVVDGAAITLFVALAHSGATHRDQPGALVATLLWVSLAAVSTVVVAGRLGLVDAELAVAAVSVGWSVAVPLWAWFASAHTGRGPTATRHRVTALGAYVFATVATTLFVGQVGGALGQTLRVLTSVLQTVLLGLGLFGVFLVTRSAFAGDLSASRAGLLTVGGVGVTTLSFSLAAAAGNSAALPTLVTAFLAATAGGFALAVFATRLFSQTPGTGPLAKRTVFEEMGEAVVVVDREDVLIDANAAAEDTFGVSLSRDAGRPAQSVLGFDVAAAAGGTVTVRTPDGSQRLDVSRSKLTDRRGDAVGTSYLLRDVTDRETREQRLQVLNRVLRHNLRNDLDAIRGFAGVLADDAGDTDEVATRIRATATELVALGETVERADHLLSRDSVDSTLVDVEDLLAAVTADVGARHECQIPVTGSQTVSVHTDRTVLRTALTEVVENAVEHSDASCPSTEIRLRETETGVSVAVNDDGPGIPEQERAVLRDGEETPLQHGSGVGLWFVSWALARLGGDLSFEDAVDGSTVVLHVPDTGTGPAGAT